MKRSPLKRKTRLARVSKKRRSQNQAYARKRKAFLLIHTYCQACPQLGSGTTLKANQVHHRFGRTGSNYLDERTWLAVCAPCHEEIHGSPNTARKLGLLA